MLLRLVRSHEACGASAPPQRTPVVRGPAGRVLACTQALATARVQAHLVVPITTWAPSSAGSASNASSRSSAFESRCASERQPGFSKRAEELPKPPVGLGAGVGVEMAEMAEMASDFLHRLGAGDALVAIFVTGSAIERLPSPGCMDSTRVDAERRPGLVP